MKQKLFELAKENDSPLYIIDHERIRENHRNFNSSLPRVQSYYAIKANCAPAILDTLYKEGSSFDVASYNEFKMVTRLVDHLDENERNRFVKEKVIFSNTIKDEETLRKVREFGPLMTFDNIAELHKIKESCDTASLLLRLKVPDSGSMVEMGSKFGADPAEAYELIKKAIALGLNIRGISFHVGSQCTNFDNFTMALEITSGIFSEIRTKGIKMDIVNIGGGFPVTYDDNVPDFEKLAEVINFECNRLFPKDVQVIAEPGRFMVANAAYLVTKIIGKSRREGKIYYHINDGVYNTFSGVIFDYWTPNFETLAEGEKEVCAVVGPTCDSFDKISLAVLLPGDLDIGDYLLTKDIGAYSIVSNTKFNGFEGPSIMDIN